MQDKKEMLNHFRKRINFRDLGGYPTKDGSTTKYGLVYRSASVGLMDEEEFSILEQMDIKTIIDLRSEAEIQEFPYAEVKGAKKLEKCALVTEEGKSIDFSPNGMRRSGKDGLEQLNKLRNYYQHVCFHNASFQLFFDILLKEEVPVLFHCASGKDRTGLMAMMFLLAMDVDEEYIRKDYLLSNIMRKEILEKTLEGIDPKEEPILYELMLMYDGVSENIFDVTMQSITNKYPTREAFFKEEYGLDETKLKQLRLLYTKKGQ
ncbi:MAG: tyrosine-protein phosphatase [Solobacterium sp.]|nr:tyrosine-protein phosphatase [Solobacterium sp.]